MLVQLPCGRLSNKENMHALLRGQMLRRNPAGIAARHRLVCPADKRSRYTCSSAKPGPGPGCKPAKSSVYE